MMQNLNTILDETYSDIQNKCKNLKVYLKSKQDSEEVTLMWERFEKKFGVNGPSELDIFTKYKDQINYADTKLLEIAQYCEKNNITYSIKVCKIKKLQTDDKLPLFITSYISVNFPINDYYKNNINDGIPDTLEEFKAREARKLK